MQDERNATLVPVIIVAAALIITAVAGSIIYGTIQSRKSAYELGEQALRAGQYEFAITCFEEAGNYSNAKLKIKQAETENAAAKKAAAEQATAAQAAAEQAAAEKAAAEQAAAAAQAAAEQAAAAQAAAEQAAAAQAAAEPSYVKKARSSGVELPQDSNWLTRSIKCRVRPEKGVYLRPMPKGFKSTKDAPEGFFDTTLPYNTSVTVYARQGNYSFVEVSDGRVGWISSEQLD